MTFDAQRWSAGVTPAVMTARATPVVSTHGLWPNACATVRASRPISQTWR